jgi:hypothetical protein
MTEIFGSLMISGNSILVEILKINPKIKILSKDRISKRIYFSYKSFIKRPAPVSLTSEPATG